MIKIQINNFSIKTTRIIYEEKQLKHFELLTIFNSLEFSMTSYKHTNGELSI